MAILTESGRVAVAQYLSTQPIHMAWGNGLPAWDATPVAPSVDDVVLVAEIGRLIATTVQFAVPAAGGSISLPEGAFNISATPTKYLLLGFEFDYTHAVGQNIRELAVFLGSTAKSSVAAGTKYLTPAQIELAGQMLVVERVAKFTRQSNTKQKFTYVIQF